MGLGFFLTCPMWSFLWPVTHVVIKKTKQRKLQLKDRNAIPVNNSTSGEGEYGVRHILIELGSCVVK